MRGGLYKRGDVYWFRFKRGGKLYQKSTKQTKIFSRAIRSGHDSGGCSAVKPRNQSKLVVGPVLVQLRLKARGSSPTGILAPLVGEQLLGHAISGHRRAVHLQDVLGRLAAKDIRPHHITGEIQKMDGCMVENSASDL
jgi:hypothetical protein